MDDARVLIAIVGVIGVLAGALVTALVSLFTGWLGRRHEHRRWLQENRLEAYLAFNRALSAWEKAMKEREAPELIRALEATADQVSLLAPLHTMAATQRLLGFALDAHRVARMGRGEGAWSDEMREASRMLLLRQRADLQHGQLVGLGYRQAIWMHERREK